MVNRRTGLVTQGGQSFLRSLGSNLLGWYDFQGGPTDTNASNGYLEVRSSGAGLSLRQPTISARPASAGSKATFTASSFQYMRQGLDPATRTSTFVSKQALPDATGGAAGHGFSCTGLVKDPTDGTWWCASSGTTDPSDVTYDPAIVHLSADFATKLADYPLSAMSITPLGSVQGLAFDTTNNTLYFTHAGDGKIYHINRSGSVLGSFSATGFNGLTYDSANDRLLGSANIDNPTLFALNKSTGAQTNLASLVGPAVDHLFFDSRDNSVWYCCDGTVPVIRKAGLSWPQIRESYPVQDAPAIEGFVISGDTAYIANDGYYHSLGDLTNEIVTVTLSPTTSTEDATPTPANIGGRYALFGVFAAAGVPATASRTLLSVGYPESANGAGIYFPVSVTNSIRATINGQNANHAVTDSTVEGIYFFDIDMAAKTSSLYLNGTFVSTQSMASLSQTALVGNLPVTVGAVDISGVLSRYPDCIAKILGAAAGVNAVTARQKFEGKMAWDTGNQSLLPSNHPYKNSAPR